MGTLTLLHTPASPFARIVRMAALERGVRLDLQLAPVHPVERNGDLGRINPLAKIPVLLTPDGQIFDSRVICRYIDRVGRSPSLYASETAEIWQIQTLEALANGILDAAVNLRYELVQRPEALRWSAWVEAQFARIDAALDRLEGEVDLLMSSHIGAIAIGAALEYLDFRHPGHEWRKARPELAGWLAGFAREAIMRETVYGELR